MTDPTGRVTDLIGHLVKISAPGKRTRTGVVLPPKPGARNRSLRLAVSADRAIPFDPAQWTIAVQHGDEYSYGNLPLELLAARTALRVEHHREPAQGQKPVALYKLRRDYADLYAICDTAPLPELSPARKAAWTKARTCARCARQSARPMRQLDDRKRYCIPCRGTLAFEHWCEESRHVQAMAAEWARAVLADPAAVLIAGDGGRNIRQLRAETVGGAALFDVRVRGFNDLGGSHWSNDSPEKYAERLEQYAGTIGPDEFAEAVMPLADARMIGWYENDRSTGHGHSRIPPIKPGDTVSERLALFSGVAPQRHGDWFPTPRLPWSHTPPTYVPYDSHRALRDGKSPITQIAHLRTLLNLMAHDTPPAPSWIDPTTGKVVIAAPSIDR